MNTIEQHEPADIPGFCQGIQYFSRAWSNFETLGQEAVIGEGQSAIDNSSAPAAVYQTLLSSDALRYLTLQITSAKGSGHPGGFASSADAYAALVMLGHTNIVTEVGH
ncbi:MAG: phosphoketolase, partial [Gammaproteobacteria bacterium]|nr:phosphoketolase [Gammaproteobacteria bacterium]